MTSVLLCSFGVRPALSLRRDLGEAGFQVLADVEDCGKLVHAVVRHAPELVVVELPRMDEAFLKALLALAEVAPTPVLLLTDDVDSERMARAVDAGVHAYAVLAYDAQRLRPLATLALARFRREQALQRQLSDVTARLEERKVVDRAKGILMRARQLSDDQAFEILRTASMHTNRRLGQVSQQIIQSARDAECLNRSGQLRMLSQRLVKHRLLQLVTAQAERHRPLLDESLQRVASNLEFLDKNLSRSTFGDLLAQVRGTWAELVPLLRGAPKAERVTQLNALAEQLLLQADRLVNQQEQTGAVATLRVLNVAGRQRMLSQRFAKQVLFGLIGVEADDGTEDRMALETRAAFEEGLRHLNGLPLTSAPIRDGLATAAREWEQMLTAAQGATRIAGRDRVARLELLAHASESLLEVFEQLSAQYESSMQMLMG